MLERVSPRVIVLDPPEATMAYAYGSLHIIFSTGGKISTSFSYMLLLNPPVLMCSWFQPLLDLDLIPNSMYVSWWVGKSAITHPSRMVIDTLASCSLNLSMVPKVPILH